MLEFTLYDEDDYSRSRRVHIDPAAVTSVEETVRRPAFGGWQPVAVITTATGDRLVVEDGARKAAQLVREAKAATAK
jgi:hypothetical protein